MPQPTPEQCAALEHLLESAAPARYSDSLAEILFELVENAQTDDRWLREHAANLRMLHGFLKGLETGISQ